MLTVQCLNLAKLWNRGRFSEVRFVATFMFANKPCRALPGWSLNNQGVNIVEHGTVHIMTTRWTLDRDMNTFE